MPNQPPELRVPGPLLVPNCGWSFEPEINPQAMRIVIILPAAGAAFAFPSGSRLSGRRLQLIVLDDVSRHDPENWHSTAGRTAVRLQFP